MSFPEFHYTPTCSIPGCANLAVYKVAADWSDGTSFELKHYGLACEDHKLGQLARGRFQRERLVLIEREAIGPVFLYMLRQKARDAELSPLSDHT